MKRRILPVLALVLLIAAAILTRGFGLWPAEEGDGLTLYGNVDIRTVDLGFRVGGRIAAMPVEEGAEVEEGAVLARLDPAPLRAAHDAAAAQVAVAAAELDQLRRGNRPQDIAQAEATVAERQAALAEAEVDYQRQQRLLKSRTISQSTFDVSEAQFRAARAQVRAAEAALSLMRAGARDEEIAAAEARHAAARAQQALARTDLDDSVLTAPQAGILLTRAREPGAIVQPGATVFTLAIARPVRIRAYVPEPALGRVRPGLAVEITTDSRDAPYHGTIGYISPTAEFTPKTVQTEELRSDLVYRLRIIVADADDGLRQGQPVTVHLPGAEEDKP